MFPIVPQNNLEGEWQTFEFEGHPVRFRWIDNILWIVAKDVCDALGLDNVSRALERVDADDKDEVTLSDVTGRRQKMAIITEAGLYTLILRSDKPSAKAFKRWLTHDVLPTLRRDGLYLSSDASWLDVADALLHQAREQERRLDEHEVRLQALESGASIPTYTVYEYFHQKGEYIPRTEILLAVGKQAARLAIKWGLMERDLGRYPLATLERAVQDVLG